MRIKKPFSVAEDYTEKPLQRKPIKDREAIKDATDSQ